MGVAEVLTVRDGLIVELDVYYKNPSAELLFWPRRYVGPGRPAGNGLVSR